MAANSAAIEAAAAEWLARRDSGRWSEQDAAALQEWLLADTAHRVAFLRLQAAWDETARLQALGAGRSAHGSQMLQAIAVRSEGVYKIKPSIAAATCAPRSAKPRPLIRR